MALTTATMAYIAVGMGAASMYMQHEAGQQAKGASERQAQAQREGQQAQERMAEVEAQRSRIAQTREARIRRAQIIASGTRGGLGVGTSGITGATGSITSQAGSNIGTIGQTQTFAGQVSAANQRAATEQSNIFSAQTTGQFWQGVGQTFGPTRGDFDTIFSKPILKAT